MTINGGDYYTNISNEDILKKCQKFFSDGCSSYAVSFYNDPKDVICTVNIEGLECDMLRGFNFDCKFIPRHARNAKSAKELLKKGLDLIELK